MKTQVEFYGPVDIYGRRVGREWEAWADPFSVVGSGQTFDEAVSDVRENVNEHFSNLAAALHEHGDKVEVLCPLSAELKRNARVRHFVVLCVRHVRDRRSPTWPRRLRKLSRSGVRKMLEGNGPVGVVPAAVVG